MFPTKSLLLGKGADINYDPAPFTHADVHGGRAFMDVSEIINALVKGTKCEAHITDHLYQ